MRYTAYDRAKKEQEAREKRAAEKKRAKGVEPVPAEVTPEVEPVPVTKSDK